MFLKVLKILSDQIRSDQSLSRVRLFATRESQHARPPCPSPTPGVYWDSRPSSQWCHPDISSSVVPFSSCPQSLQASESFPRCPFHYRGLECKRRKSRNTWNNRQIWPWSTEWSRAKTWVVFSKSNDLIEGAVVCRPTEQTTNFSPVKWLPY